VLCTANHVRRFPFLKSRLIKFCVLKLSKKTWVPVLALCLLLGAASAAIVAIRAAKNTTSIFTDTKNECPGIKWDAVADTLHPSHPIKVEGELYFAGERVPLEDPEVKERLERELVINSYWHSNTILGMKMANRYFPEIEKTLAEQGVPDDFKYMALIESNFRLEASPAGAVGFWQMVKGTAKVYNIEMNEEVDERYNVEKATVGACTYLKDAKERLGNWTLAAASYNMGLAAMMLRSKEQQMNNYYDMYFNPETSRYVFRMLALKIIFSNPKNAGFDLAPEDLYAPYKYKVVEVDTPIASIADFAARFGLKYKHIKTLNPWLRDARLTNKEHRKYEIKIWEND
jgi:membrane-bound lytic murein transglycosylase D